MDDNHGSRAVGQPVTFFGDKSLDELGVLPQDRAELEQEIARRTAGRLSTRALRAAFYPQHLGVMDQPDGHGRVFGECGDLMAFYLRVEDGRIHAITFTTEGCDATIASAEVLASLVDGMSLDEAQQVTSVDLLVALDGLPPNHTHCAALAVKTLRQTIASCNGDGKS